MKPTIDTEYTDVLNESNPTGNSRSLPMDTLDTSVPYNRVIVR